jgi:type I restriction enzyme S subunit
MSELKKYRFSDLYEMSSGISTTKAQSGHGSPFLSFSSVFNNYFVPEKLNDLMDTSEKEQETYSIQNGDIFLTRTSEVIDELGMSSVAIKDYPNATFSGFLKRLRPTKSKVTYPKYMAFYLRSQLFRKTMTNNAVMTLRASLNEAIFSYFELFLPEYDDQVKAGDLLFLMNQKIELNNRINAELEAMAKTLYDYWFVQFDFPDANGKPYKTSGGKMVYNAELKREIPEEWMVVKLKNIAKTGSGGTPLRVRTEYYDNGTIPWINSGEVNQSFIVSTENFITELGLKNSSAKIFDKNTILMAMYGATAGKVSFIDFEAATNQAICAIIPFSSNCNIYIKFFLERIYGYLNNLSSGSARDNLSQDKINELDIINPTDDVLKKFDDFTSPIMSKILFNMKENQSLSIMRDWLLPMLMNGQVTVK